MLIPYLLVWSDDGHVDTWTCPMILLSTTLLGGIAGDEDPLPPDGANPHPMPLVHAGFWHDANHGQPMEVAEQVGNIQQNAAPSPDVAPSALNELELNINPATPVMNGEDFIPVPETD